MTIEQAKELLPVIQAYVDGLQIQYKDSRQNEWCDVLSQPNFEASGCQWRVKPQPREFWVNVYDGCLCAHPDSKTAQRELSANGRTIHVREVL